MPMESANICHVLGNPIISQAGDENMQALTDLLLKQINNAQ